MGREIGPEENRRINNGVGRTICFDFDGVIHRYTSGWIAADVIPDGPVPGIGKLIATLREQGFRVVVNSARCRYSEGFPAVKEHLDAWEIEVDEVCEHKPAAVIYVDDRAVRFDGCVSALWDDIQGALRMGAWTEREKSCHEKGRRVE